MERDPDLRTIEIYLSELHDHLYNYGVHRNRRMEHVEQAADSLLESGAAPEDELGPSLAYAAQLAHADGAPLARRHPWYRAAAAMIGVPLVFVAGMSLLFVPVNWHDPIQVYADSAVIFVAIGCSFAYGLLRPRRHTGAGLAGRHRWLAVVLSIPGIIAITRLLGDVAWEGPTAWKMAPVLGLATALGAALVWYSGWLQVAAVSALRFSRRESSLSYDANRRPAIEVYRRQPPPPASKR